MGGARTRRRVRRKLWRHAGMFTAAGFLGERCLVNFYMVNSRFSGQLAS